MLRFVASMLFALSAGTAAAANIDPRLAKFDVCGRFEIFHINGIQTIERDARDNLDQLGIAYGNSHNEHLIAYRLAYNPTQGALLDLVDVFAQKLNEYPGATFAMIVRAFLGRVRTPLPEALADELQRILIERIRGTGYVSLNDADLARVVDRIRSQRGRGAKTVLVPHSQGNLYANSAYALLTQAAVNPVPAKSLAIIGVASPAAFVAGTNGRYVTSRQDLVIFGLRRLLGARSVLPGNVTQPVTLDDPLGHNFVAVYLRPGTDARTRLLGDIAAAFDALRTVLAEPATLSPLSRFTASGNWIPEVEAHPPWACEAMPARVLWGDGWSNPPQLAARERPGALPEMEAQLRTNVRACYEKALQIMRARLLLPLNAPIPDELWMKCNHLGYATGPDAARLAWEAHSAELQVEQYRQFLFTSDGRYRNYQKCGNGFMREYTVFGAHIGEAWIAPACRRE